MYKSFLKRIVDIVLVIFFIVITSPIMLIVAVLLIIENKGEVVFKQNRIGKDTKIFKMYKFRTMSWDNKKSKAEVTKLGEFLRKTSLDELPQLINILKGEMSFIGPRPWIEEYLKYFTNEQKRRCEVMPGISGWAQVNGRNNNDILKKIEYDIYYVDNISFKMDLKIFFLTIRTVFKKEHATLHYMGIQDELKELKTNFENQN